MSKKQNNGNQEDNGNEEYQLSDDEFKKLTKEQKYQLIIAQKRRKNCKREYTPKVIRLKGIWKGINISEEDIQVNRDEMLRKLEEKF